MELSGLSRQADIWKLLSLAWVMGWWTLQNSIRLVPMIDQAGELVLSVCYITKRKWHILQMIYAVHTAKSKFTVHQSQWLASRRHQFGRRRLLASELHCSFLSNPTSAIGNPCAYKSLMVRLPIQVFQNCVWHFNSQGVYSSQSLYKVINFSGVTSVHVPAVWALKISPRVHFFSYGCCPRTSSWLETT